MNECCGLCVWGSLRHITGFYILLTFWEGKSTSSTGLFLKVISCPLRTGQMIFEKHLNASLKDTNESTFQFSLTKIKINLSLWS